MEDISKSTVHTRRIHVEEVVAVKRLTIMPQNSNVMAAILNNKSKDKSLEISEPEVKTLLSRFQTMDTKALCCYGDHEKIIASYDKLGELCVCVLET